MNPWAFWRNVVGGSTFAINIFFLSLQNETNEAFFVVPMYFAYSARWSVACPNCFWKIGTLKWEHLHNYCITFDRFSFFFCFNSLLFFFHVLQMKWFNDDFLCNFWLQNRLWHFQNAIYGVHGKSVCRFEHNGCINVNESCRYAEFDVKW